MWALASTDGENGGLPFQTYQLSYAQSPNSSQSLLASVTRSSLTQSLPPTTLSYRDNSAAAGRFKFADKLSVYNWTTPQANELIWSKDAYSDTRRKTIDLDGDGRPDWVDATSWTNTSTGKKLKVYINNGQGFNAGVDWPAPTKWIQTINENTGVTTRDTLDLNGDGRPDHVVCNVLPWQVYWNNGQGFDATFQRWTAPQANCRASNGTYDTFDINGDGKLDYVRANLWTSPFWKVSLNQYPAQIGFGTQTDFPVSRKAGGTEVLTEIRDGGGYVATFDLNNDGLPDHIRISGGVWSIYLNEGTRIRHRKDWTPPLNRIRYRNASNNYEWDTFDINGDGILDLVDGRSWTAANPTWKVYLGTGNPETGFLATAQNWGAPYQRIRYAKGQDKDVFDLDGDGLPDFVDGIWECTQWETVCDEFGCWDNCLTGEIRWETWFNQGFSQPQKLLQQSPTNPVRSDLLEVANNGLGGKTSVTYLPSTVWDNRGGDGIPDLPFPVWTVDSLKREDGLGATHTFGFSYQDGRLDATDPLGTEFRGFSWVTETDPLGNRLATNFHQDPIKKGKPAALWVDNAAGASVKDTLWTWEETSCFADPLINWVDPACAGQSGTERRRLSLKQRAERLYKDATQYEELLAVNDSFDGYGNLTASHTEGARAARVDTTTTYTASMGTYIVDRPASITPRDASGVLEKKELSYDTRGNLTQVIVDPAGIRAITTFRYDPYGNRDQETNARGNTTTYTYDAAYKTYQETIQKPLLIRPTTQTFDGRWGKLKSSTDPNLAQWQWSYDGFGRLLREVLPGETLSVNPQRIFTYTEGSQGVPSRVQVQYKEPNAVSGYREERSFFDPFGRLLQEKHETHLEGSTNKTVVAGQTLVYNGRGRVAKRIAAFEAPGLDTYSPNPNGAGTSFAYDALDRVVQQTNPDGTGKSLSYSGFTTTLIDEAGNQRITIQDAYGRTIEERLYQGTITLLTKRAYAYDGLGRLLSKTLSDNPATRISMSYDRLGRKTSMSDPDSGSWSYIYDKEDNLTSQTDPKGNTVNFTYDALDRLLTKQYPGGSQISFTYDQGTNGQERLTSVTDLGGSSSSFTYDARGNLTSKTQTIQGNPLTFDFTPDTADRISSTKYPADGAVPSETVTNTYNDTGQLTGVSSPLATYVSSIHYDRFGRQKKVFYGNGVVDQKNYYEDPGNFRLSSLQTCRGTSCTSCSGATCYQNLSYAYDPVGNISQITDPLPNGTLNNSQSYSYDGLYRLTQSSGSQQFTCSYSYNNIGNITNKCGLVYTYNPSKPHQPTSIGSMNIGYDSNGNLTSKTGSTGYSASYDYDDQLQTIMAGSVSLTHTYDYAGQRAIKSPSVGNPVRYWGGLLEIEGSTLRKHYFALGARVGTRQQGGATSLLFYHTDHLGSPQVLTDGTGNVVQYIRYRPYGEIRGIFDSSGGSPASRYLFTDKEKDLETGLDYFGARFYDSEIALFLTHDPQAQFDSPYSYADGNPVNLVDPDGEYFPSEAPPGPPADPSCCVIGADVAAGVDIQLPPEETGGGTASRERRPVIRIPPEDRPPTPEEMQKLLDLALMMHPAGAAAKIGSKILGKVGSKLGQLIRRFRPEKATKILGNTRGAIGKARNWAQDKLLSKGEIQKLKKAGIDPEGLKGSKSTGKLDLYKDPQGRT